MPGHHAAERLASALRALVGVEDPKRSPPHSWRVREHPGPPPGPREGRCRINDGEYSYRNPADHFALPPARLARVSVALAPDGCAASSHHTVLLPGPRVTPRRSASASSRASPGRTRRRR
ncbi:hypothetical protein ACR6C2_29180 [Streptomyces sp. INA 01156]